MRFEGRPEHINFEISKAIAAEFESTYAFKERLARVEKESIAKIINQYSVEADIAKTIFILELENKLTVKEAYEYLMWIRQIYEKEGSAIPSTPSHTFQFAVREGSWLLFLYGKFINSIEDKLKELVNAEFAVDSDQEPPFERTIGVINSRKNVIANYLAPLITKWINEHDNLSQIHAIAAILAPILKIKPGETYDYIVKGQRAARKLFFEFDKALEKDELVEQGVNFKNTVLDTRKNLLLPLDKMPLEVLCQVLLQAIPRNQVKKQNSNSSAILIPHSPITRNGLVGPELKTPIDFLERDLIIAKMRSSKERKEFLSRILTKVFKNLNYEISDPIEISSKIISETQKRLDKKPLNNNQITKIIYEMHLGKEGLSRLLEDAEAKLTVNQKNKPSLKDILDYIKVKSPLKKEDILAAIVSYIEGEIYLKGVSP